MKDFLRVGVVFHVCISVREVVEDKVLDPYRIALMKSPGAAEVVRSITGQIINIYIMHLC